MHLTVGVSRIIPNAGPGSRDVPLSSRPVAAPAISARWHHMSFPTPRVVWPSYGREMNRDVVTGYCWPQSARPGDQIGLHMSSSAGRPVRVEVARVGARREVVFICDA